MSQPAPRDFLEDKSAFGSARAVWRPETGQDPGVVAAAYLQHRLALQVATSIELGAPLTSTSALADAVGQNKPAMERKLSGARWTSLADVLTWGMMLGGNVLGVLKIDDREILPNEYRSWMGDWTAGSGSLPAFARRRATLAGIDWDGVARAIRGRLAALLRNGLLGVLTQDAFRQIVIEALVDLGVNGFELFVDDAADSGEQYDITVGSLRQEVLQVLLLPSSADSRALVAQAVRRLFDTLVRLAGSTTESRFLVFALPPRIAVATKDRIPQIDQLGPLEVTFDSITSVLRPGTAAAGGEESLVGDLALEIICALDTAALDSGLSLLIASVGKLRPLC